MVWCEPQRFMRHMEAFLGFLQVTGQSNVTEFNNNVNSVTKLIKTDIGLYRASISPRSKKRVRNRKT